ncbi:hypothetical protein BBD42_16210 [Paenibacillus sp. BIHB 4019]|uniref:Uncharacterized protein n=1 Tax=Paenibacillus sp. BIHB 4019 TaxID=1870819 RepID=A0A1B2DJG0_9BACL|nr:hypothetical protein [Paenibacillus sp. BIHB 4019]ANY67843.1 hypothetical protein BBD42_16210 [Paenibacillus sp. BIHB 4019]
MLYNSLKEEGLGQEPGDAKSIISNLLTIGLNDNEAKEQYEAELTFSKEFSSQSWLTYDKYDDFFWHSNENLKVT